MSVPGAYSTIDPVYVNTDPQQELGTVLGQQIQGPFDGTAHYVPGQEVTSLGHSYVCILTGNDDTVPGDDQEHWQLVD